MIHIEQYADRHTEAVRRFNERLRAGGASSRFPVAPVPTWLPKIDGRSIFQEYYLALDEEGEVRGAYILKHQDFQISGRVVRIADFHMPISEGVVDRRYSQVGVTLLRDALSKQPLLYGLGIGGYEEPLARMFEAAGWSMFSVPFFFHVIRPKNFLRNVVIFRRSALKRTVFDLAAVSGLGWFGIRAIQMLHHRKTAASSLLVEVDTIDKFTDWADKLWRSCKERYSMSAVRDAETLRILYPKNNKRFLRLKITKESKTIGWAVVLDSQLSGHKHFGDMRLGAIVDCFASVDDTAAVVDAARRFLESRGVDLIVSNQSHAAWQKGFREAGFLNGPSNFIFAASKKLAELLKNEGVENDDLHFNRGDGDGPIHL